LTVIHSFMMSTTLLSPSSSSSSSSSSSTSMLVDAVAQALSKEKKKCQVQGCNNPKGVQCAKCLARSCSNCRLGCKKAAAPCSHIGSFCAMEMCGRWQCYDPLCPHTAKPIAVAQPAAPSPAARSARMRASATAPPPNAGISAALRALATEVRKARHAHLRTWVDSTNKYLEDAKTKMRTLTAAIPGDIAVPLSAFSWNPIDNDQLVSELSAAFNRVQKSEISAIHQELFAPLEVLRNTMNTRLEVVRGECHKLLLGLDEYDAKVDAICKQTKVPRVADASAALLCLSPPPPPPSEEGGGEEETDVDTPVSHGNAQQ
jgi:hypothetical protein